MLSQPLCGGTSLTLQYLASQTQKSLTMHMKNFKTLEWNHQGSTPQKHFSSLCYTVESSILYKRHEFPTFGGLTWSLDDALSQIIAVLDSTSMSQDRQRITKQCIHGYLVLVHWRDLHILRDALQQNALFCSFQRYFSKKKKKRHFVTKATTVRSEWNTWPRICFVLIINKSSIKLIKQWFLNK